MTIQIQCQNCFHWVTHHILFVALRSVFGKEFAMECGLCKREIKFLILK